MGELIRHQVIDESSLDRRYYFQALFQEACRTGQLSESRIEQIQIELVELMGKEVERYTNDESSSVPVEKAQEILQSITYSMGIFLKNTTDMTQKIDILKEMKVRDLFYKGMETVSAAKSRASALLEELQKNSRKFDNYAYQDTIHTGLPDFFHDYNIEFGAQEIPASFDYPSFETITDLLGVEYIEKYLKSLVLEDRFLRHFSDFSVNLLLKGFDREAEHMLINLFELVLTNAIGCALLGQKVTGLDISGRERQWLQHNLEQLDKLKLEAKLEEALAEINSELMLDFDIYAYAKAVLSPLTSRLYHNLQNNSLGEVFISFNTRPEEEAYYEDGIPMEDQSLRELIEELRDCGRTSDKIALIRENVRSMADFVELMDECFYEEEYDEVLSALSENERLVLRKVLLLDAGTGHFEEYEPQKPWQKKLFQPGSIIK